MVYVLCVGRILYVDELCYEIRELDKEGWVGRGFE